MEERKFFLVVGPLHGEVRDEVTHLMRRLGQGSDELSRRHVNFREIVISMTLILILRFQPQVILPEHLPKLAQE